MIYHVTSRMLGDDLTRMLTNRRVMPCGAPGPEDTVCTRAEDHPPGLHAAGTQISRPATGEVFIVIAAVWMQSTNQEGHDDHAAHSVDSRDSAAHGGANRPHAGSRSAAQQYPGRA